MVAKLLILLVTEDMDKKFAIFNKLGELTKHIQQIHPLQILLPKNLKSWKHRLEKSNIWMKLAQRKTIVDDQRPTFVKSFLITGDPFVKKISRQVQYSWSFGCQMLKSEGQWRNWSFGCLISKNGNNNADKYNILGLFEYEMLDFGKSTSKNICSMAQRKNIVDNEKNTQELEFYTLKKLFVKNHVKKMKNRRSQFVLVFWMSNYPYVVK